MINTGNTIEKFLNKLGYIKLEIIEDIDFSPKAEVDLFNDLSKVDGFKEYLNSVMAKDVKRYFVADAKSQDIIKGGFSRIVYLKSRLNKTI